MTDRMTDLAHDTLAANIEANRPKHGYEVVEWHDDGKGFDGRDRLNWAAQQALEALTKRDAIRLARDADDTDALCEAEASVYHEVLTHADAYGVDDLVADAGNGFGGPGPREIRGYPQLAITA